MQQVTIKKDALLATLTTNREKHTQIFEEAQVGYRKRVIDELDALLAKAKRGERVPSYWRLQAPVNQTPEYDRAILMLQMSVDDQVTLSAQDFESYVMDRWAWKKQFLASNKSYSVTAALLDDTEDE